MKLVSVCGRVNNEVKRVPVCKAALSLLMIGGSHDPRCKGGARGGD